MFIYSCTVHIKLIDHVKFYQLYLIEVLITRDGRKARPDRIRTGPGTYGPSKTQPTCMKKADPGIDFQCPAVSGHGSGHNTKYPAPGPVPAFY